MVGSRSIIFRRHHDPSALVTLSIAILIGKCCACIDIGIVLVGRLRVKVMATIRATMMMVLVACLVTMEGVRAEVVVRPWRKEPITLEDMEATFGM